MAISNDVRVNKSVGLDGNTFTSSVSNDQLTSEDFLKLMIEEMKLQDPTSPMDSSKMLQTQMQMSTMDANIQMTKSMKALQDSIANMTLTNAMSFMDKKVDAVVDKPVIGDDGKALKDNRGNTITEKVKASFIIKSVRVDDGKTFLESFELIGFQDRLGNKQTGGIVDYDSKTGRIKDKDGNDTEYYIKLDKDGMFELNSSGKIVITDVDGNVKHPKFTPEGQTEEVDLYSFVGTDEIYSKNVSNVQYADIVKIY